MLSLRLRTQSRNPGTRKVSEGLTISFVPVDLCHTHKPRGGGPFGAVIALAADFRLRLDLEPRKARRSAGPGAPDRRRGDSSAGAWTGPSLRGADGPGPGSLSRNSRLPRAADSDSDRPTDSDRHPPLTA
jgi:hypothetical protein